MGVMGIAAVVCVSGIAAAEPPPVPAPQPPPPPNVNALAPVKLSEYAVMDNNWYAFSTPDGLTCVLQKGNGYGCSGPIPGAPEGANLVSGSYGGGSSCAKSRAPGVRGAGPATRWSAGRGGASRCPLARESATRPSAAATTGRRRPVSTPATSRDS